MPARVTGDGVESAYAAAEAWVDCALRTDGSLFTPGKPIWTRELLRDLLRPGRRRSHRCEHIGVVDAVAPSQRRRNQGNHLVAGVGPPRGAAETEVIVYEFPQAQVLGEGGRQEQPGIGHQAVVVKDDGNPVGWLRGSILGAPCSGVGLLLQTIIPEAQEYLLAASGR